ncbi:metallophosphoesterase [bacterium]|nr:MAG: metallophosphoesterase [bacterium]
MRIGVLSDTHDNLPKVKKAVSFFNRNKVDFVLHAGDFVAPFVIPYLDKLESKWLGVFGNNDGERKGLSKSSRKKIKEGPLRIVLAGKKILLVHDKCRINPKKEKVQVIIFGHTHHPEVVKDGDKLFINPGECGGWLSSISTVGIIDLSSLTAKIHKI